MHHGAKLLFTEDDNCGLFWNLAIYNGNWTEWRALWSESKSQAWFQNRKKRAARVWFDIMQKYYFRPKLYDSKFNYYLLQTHFEITQCFGQYQYLFDIHLKKPGCDLEREIDHKLNLPKASCNFVGLWKSLLVLIYSKLYSKSCYYLYW